MAISIPRSQDQFQPICNGRCVLQKNPATPGTVIGVIFSPPEWVARPSLVRKLNSFYYLCIPRGGRSSLRSEPHDVVLHTYFQYGIPHSKEAKRMKKVGKKSSKRSKRVAKNLKVETRKPRH